jgi:hypothetical protein
MATSDLSQSVLRLDARRAYELGRLRGALLLGAGAAIIALPGYFACNRTPVAALCVAGFAVVVAAGRIRGEGYDEGARAGALAGILPCLLPALLRLVDTDLCNTVFAGGSTLCALGGVAAGAILGARSRTADGFPFWTSAFVTLGLAASLGCIPAGVMGFAGLAAGVALGAVPVLVARKSSF